MTLHRDNPKNTRPPMKTRTMWIWIGVAAAALIFVLIDIAANGISLF
ncbi:hypothetical protein [Glaciihabitans sp. dw_435]|nr:hypothetical protein [Glaciihabitans sp. dw_435]